MEQVVTLFWKKIPKKDVCLYIYGKWKKEWGSICFFILYYFCSECTFKMFFCSFVRKPTYPVSFAKSELTLVWYFSVFIYDLWFAVIMLFKAFTMTPQSHFFSLKNCPPAPTHGPTESSQTFSKISETNQQFFWTKNDTSEYYISWKARERSMWSTLFKCKCISLHYVCEYHLSIISFIDHVFYSYSFRIFCRDVTFLQVCSCQHVTLFSM